MYIEKTGHPVLFSDGESRVKTSGMNTVGPTE